MKAYGKGKRVTAGLLVSDEMESTVLGKDQPTERKADQLKTNKDGLTQDSNAALAKRKDFKYFYSGRKLL